MSRNRLSGGAKTVLVVQTLFLAALAFWLGKEYQNNIYLRQYVHNTAWTYLPVLAFIATFSIAVGVTEAYSRVGGKNTGTLPIERGTVQGMLLAGTFDPPTQSSRDPSQQSVSEKPGESSELSIPGVNFAQVFQESRPPTVLKRIEQETSLDTYTPPPYPVIKRLKPPLDPVEVEKPKPTPRPLNRVGLAPGYTIPPPPVIRQISRPPPRTLPETTEKREAFPRAEPESRNEQPARNETPKLPRPRPLRKKPVIHDDLANDLTGT